MTEDQNEVYSSVEEIIEASYGYLESNEVSGERWGKSYHFYKPAQTKYGPFQWLWDSGWHMIVWSHRNVENAIKDLESMLEFQQPNGFIPEMIYWGERSKFARFMDRFIGYSHEKYTDISQMPMLAYSLRAIYNATQDIELLETYVPRLVEYFHWWERERDPDGDGLISIIHPWESGIDASPLYDPVWGLENPGFWQLYPKFLKTLRYYKKKVKWDQEKILEKTIFNVEDVGVNSVYAAGWGELAKLARLFDPSLSSECAQKQQKFEQAILSKCWNPQRHQFISYYQTESAERPSNIQTIQSLFPLLLDSLPQKIEDALIEDLTNPEKFWLPYPVPSVPKNEPTFNPEESRLLWRGPTWPCTTWLVMEGLLKHDHLILAKKILDRWIEMYKKNGIYEYHHPINGKGEGEEGLGMSLTIVDMIHRIRKLE